MRPLKKKKGKTINSTSKVHPTNAGTTTATPTAWDALRVSKGSPFPHCFNDCSGIRTKKDTKCTLAILVGQSIVRRVGRLYPSPLTHQLLAQFAGLSIQ